MLPGTLPLFPLPNVVLFPDVFLPLHIFEPRYREMTRAALDGNRLIGMVLAKSAAEPDECYPVGCAGVITHVEELDGGRYNIILRGLQKFRILAEDETAGRPYRIASVEAIPDGPYDKADLKALRAKLEALLVSSGTANFSFRLPPSMPDSEFVHALSQYFGFEAIERQALLEMSDPSARCRALIELVEMQVLMGSNDWKGRSN
ncbi:MAG: ATP-dependent protease [Acidobacteria bacterium]|nr:MAG: ATP-dependent protease [Acidobacteriota bacterium]